MARTPCGSKSPSTVIKFAVINTAFLLSQRVPVQWPWPAIPLLILRRSFSAGGIRPLSSK
jgi:hypothetical protein